jgi:hypothetical protein
LVTDTTDDDAVTTPLQFAKSGKEREKAHEKNRLDKSAAYPVNYRFFSIVEDQYPETLSDLQSNEH